MRRILPCAAALLLAACGPAHPTGGDGGNGNDGGTSDGGGGGPGWTVYPVSGPTELTSLALAVAPDGRVGMAHFVAKGTPDGGSVEDYDLVYQEWKDGSVSAPETITTVQRVYGLSLAFGPDGQPAVGYLGGGSDMSVYWLQSDAAISRRSASGTWTEELVATHSNNAPAGNPVSDTGFLVGIFPALAFDGSDAWLAWRDCHNGQFPQQDWAGSDLEIAQGSGGGWSPQVVMAGGNDKQAYGGHTRMVIAGGQPALVSDQIFGSAAGPGQNLLFNLRRQDGTWSKVRPMQADIGNTQSGPSLAWDASLGFGIAVVDRTQDELFYLESQDGQSWSVPDPVYQSGTGGWYPSLSISPVTHDPSIAFYVCSVSAGAAEGSCPPAEDELRVTERVVGQWREQLVDSAGGWHPQLGHLASGQRVIAYRDPQDGSVKLAVER